MLGSLSAPSWRGFVIAAEVVTWLWDHTPDDGVMYQIWRYGCIRL